MVETSSRQQSKLAEFLGQSLCPDNRIGPAVGKNPMGFVLILRPEDTQLSGQEKDGVRGLKSCPEDAVCPKTPSRLHNARPWLRFVFTSKAHERDVSKRERDKSTFNSH